MFYSLPIHLIRQFLFCPRIPYFMEVQKISPVYPLWLQQGTNYHVEQKKLMNRRALNRFGLENAAVEYNIHISSEKFGIHGIIDSLLITENYIYPIEFKMSAQKPSYSHIMQLVAYGILAEEKYQKKCNKGFIVHDQRGKTVTIDLLDEKKEALIKLVQKIKESFNDVLPHSSARINQCVQCEFYSYCNDRE